MRPLASVLPLSLALGGLLALQPSSAASTGWCRTTPPAPHATPGELDPRTLLGELPARATRLGAGAPSLVTSAEAVDNEWVGGFVDVPKEDCLLGYARGSSSIEDVDVAIYSDEGTQLGRRRGARRAPDGAALPAAPATASTWRRTSSTARGSSSSARSSCRRSGRLVVARALGARGARGRGAAPGRSVARAGRRGARAPARARRLVGGVQARRALGRRSAADVRLVPHRGGRSASTRWSCRTTTSALLDVEAVDGDGRVVARAREGGGARTLTVCSPAAMPGTLAVRPHVGRGLAAVVLARARGEVARDLSARPEIAWAAASNRSTRRATRTIRCSRRAATRSRWRRRTGTLLAGPPHHGAARPEDPRRRVRARRRRRGSAARAARGERMGRRGGAPRRSGEASTSLALFACARDAGAARARDARAPGALRGHRAPGALEGRGLRGAPARRVADARARGGRAGHAVRGQGRAGAGRDARRLARACRGPRPSRRAGACA